MSTIDREKTEFNYDRPGPTPKLKSFFGEEALQKLDELLANSIVPEIDRMAHDGDIDFLEASEYAMHLPEYHQLRTELRALANEFAMRMEKKLPHYFSRIFNRNGTINVKAYEKHFNGLRMLLFELLQTSSTKEKVTGWNGRIIEFFEFLDQALILSLRTYAKSVFEDPLIRIQAGYQVQSLAYNTPHPFTHETGEKSYYHLAVNGVQIMEHMTSLHQWKAIESDLIADIPQVSISDLWEEAEDLSQFREIPVSSLLIGHYEIAIKSGYTNRPGVRSQYLASVVIADRATGTSILDFSICRSTGDLFIPTTNLCLGTYMDPKAYQSLRAHLFKLICSQLRGTSENIASHVTVVTQELEAIHEELKTRLPEEEPTNVISFPTERQKPVFNLSRLRNLSSQKVLRALTRLLGPPVRIRGSHHFFSTRDGGAYPISIHKGRTVKTGLLRACLEKMGLDPIEFYEAL